MMDNEIYTNNDTAVTEEFLTGFLLPHVDEAVENAVGVSASLCLVSYPSVKYPYHSGHWDAIKERFNVLTVTYDTWMDDGDTGIEMTRIVVLIQDKYLRGRIITLHLKHELWQFSDFGCDVVSADVKTILKNCTVNTL